jgi:hypothetical protein
MDIRPYVYYNVKDARRIKMPVVYNQLIPANNALPGYNVAKELARQSVAQFGAVRGANAGIGPGSCCAALAVIPNNAYPAANALVTFAVQLNGAVIPVYGGPLPYGVVYGNSQMAHGGLVPQQVGGHAERAALTAAGGIAVHLQPGNNAVLFVELFPCGPCQNWLNGQGGGMANPYIPVFNAVFNAPTLNVWWRWPYPGGGGVAAMNAFHNWTLQAELNDINNFW